MSPSFEYSIGVPSTRVDEFLVIVFWVDFLKANGSAKGTVEFPFRRSRTCLPPNKIPTATSTVLLQFLHKWQCWKLCKSQLIASWT